jgi:hypothetical protein
VTETWRPRLVVLDLDGTTVQMNQTEPSPRVRRAVRATMAAGVPVGVATGRAVWSSLPATAALGIDQPQALSMVCSNGAVVYDAARRRAVHRAVIDPGPALRALAAARPEAGFAAEHGVLGYRYTRQFVRDFPSNFLEEVELSVLGAEPTTRLSGRLPGIPIQRAHSRCESATEWVTESGLDPADYSLEIGFSGWVDVCAPGVSKAGGVALLARDIGVEPSDVLVIGDGSNDLSMFAWAGRSIAMGQAPPEVRAAADEVTASVEDDGVALALERWFG